MAKKKSKKTVAVPKQLLDTWDAFIHGECDWQTHLKVLANQKELVAFLDSPEGLRWQVGALAARRMAESAAQFEDEIMMGGLAKEVCNDLRRRGLSVTTVANVLLQGFVHGYHTAASASAHTSRTGRRAGSAMNAAKAEARGRRIVDAYDATDPSLSEAERYAAVKRATGIKSTETIRKYLRAR